MNKSPKHRYNQWKFRLRTLKCDIDMSFDEWYGWWEATGHWNDRGRGRNQYCMSRIDKSLPYNTGNVECILNPTKDRKDAIRKGVGIISPTASYDTLRDASEAEHHRRKTIRNYIESNKPGWSYK
jgi:hypothetical protein